MKILVNFAASLLLTLVLFSSCHKKKEGVPATEGATPSSPTAIDGQVVVIRTYNFVNDTVRFWGDYASAFFFKHPKNKDSVVYNDLLDAGDVAMNQIKLTAKSDLSYFYISDSSQAWLKPSVWKITGTSVFGSFNYSDDNPYASYGGEKDLLDTLVLQKAVNLVKVTNYRDAQKVEIYIEKDTGQPSSTKTIHFPNQEVIFTPADTDVFLFPLPASGKFSISFYNDTYKIFNGKVINFRTITTYYKSGVWLKLR